MCIYSARVYWSDVNLSAHCIYTHRFLFIETYRVLTIDDNLKHVKEAVWDIRSEWNKFGEHLPGVDAGTINSIKKSEKDHGECLNEVLSKWIYKGRATINDLLKALRKTMVGRDDIADRICNLKGEKGAGVGL